MTGHDENKVFELYTVTGWPGFDIGCSSHRIFPESECVPLAKGTNMRRLARDLIPDRGGEWADPVFIGITRHHIAHGISAITGAMYVCLESVETVRIDILSITAGITDGKIVLCTMLRAYLDKRPRAYIEKLVEDIFRQFYAGMGETEEIEEAAPELIIPPGARRYYTDWQIQLHDNYLAAQESKYSACTGDKPFLNGLDHYEKRDLFEVDPFADLVYDLEDLDRKLLKTSIKGSYESFMKAFRLCLRNASEGGQRHEYKKLLWRLNTLGKKAQEEAIRAFLRPTEKYYTEKVVKTMHITALENRTAVMAKLHEALFDYYIIKPLINDPMITDIKLCGPNDITVRIGGKTYASNLSFMDEDDYSRFIIMVAIKNNRQIDVAQQEFHDHSHPLYRMRITITANYISSSGNAYMAIRKHSKEKPMDDYFLKAGMFNEVVRDYLADCALHSKAVLFAGATGAGKTELANWFLEQYEKSAAILIIQETDALFSDRKGIMFENVMMHPQEGQQYCPLEALGRLALVTSSNVFGIGEVKGPEIASAITLAGSGCRIFMTIHADSAGSVLTKCANLVRKNAAYQGIASDQINRELLAFQTIVFLKDYKVDEILEVAGYDSMSGEFAYRHIYKREEEKETSGREIQF